MKKLNKTELSIIAKRIRKNLEEKADIAQKKHNALEDKNNLSRARKLARELKQISPEGKAYIGKRIYRDFNWDEKFTVESILKDMQTTQKEIIVPAYYHSAENEIMDSLILAQLDAEDIDSLIRQVTAKFVKSK